MKSAILSAAILGMAAASAAAGDLELLRDGASDYQIVLPDEMPSEAVGDSLRQAARLVQTAFAANGAKLDVVAESERDANRPALLLGNTKAARKQGIEAAKIEGWGYVHRVVGRDVLVVGHDHPAKVPSESGRRPNWDRVGTVKGVVDFLREYAGVRFLYPDIPTYSPVSAAANVDLRQSPAIEFLSQSTIVVPDDLNVRKIPLLRQNIASPQGGGFYDLAHNRFPRVDELFGGHTWERAVPPQLFAEHPEYFALLSGTRQIPEGGRVQYCLSNPDVQELIYRDLATQFDRGYHSADLGQPDGFRPCQCQACADLYGTGDDWSEKIWLFNRSIAERLEQSHPGKQVTMMSYILTAAPPKSFQKFPANTSIMLTGTNEDDIVPWRAYEVPRGFTGYVYNWCPNLVTRYTPMRTPTYVEKQVKRLAANRIQALLRDGAGQLFGLEGPVYYVMGRVFDDPDRYTAKDLMPEFCDAAFGDAAAPMSSFYDQLYHAINLYSDHIGTRNDAWQYYDTAGLRRKTVSDPFQLLAFLYSPTLLAALDADLTQAERTATAPKVRTRLALVRTEFEYLRSLMRVVHLNHAFQVQPDESTRDRLLDAIDARNAVVEALFPRPRKVLTSQDFAYVFFPPPGHDVKHLALAVDRYQEPFGNTCLQWDTARMRAAPLPTKKSMTVARATMPVAIDSEVWKSTPEHELTHVPPLLTLPRRTGLRLLYDDANVYVHATCELDAAALPKVSRQARDRSLARLESFDIYLAPQPARDVAYRFTAGMHAEAKYDAAAGLIRDAMDPRFGRDDVSWNGQWESVTQFDESAKQWTVLVTIPFATLDAAPPQSGTMWRGNFGRNRQLLRDRIDRSIWSSNVGEYDFDDRRLFGDIVFQ